MNVCSSQPPMCTSSICFAKLFWRTCLKTSSSKTCARFVAKSELADLQSPDVCMNCYDEQPASFFLCTGLSLVAHVLLASSCSSSPRCIFRNSLRCCLAMETLPTPAQLLVTEFLGLASTALLLSALAKTSRARDVVGSWLRQVRTVPEAAPHEGSGEEEDLTDDEVCMPSRAECSLEAAVVVGCLRTGRVSWNSNCGVLRSLEDMDISYPGLIEAVTADVAFMTANVTGWTLPWLQQAVGLPSAAYQMRLEDFLSDALGTSGEFLTAWRLLNAGSEAVESAIAWLQHGQWEYAFFPSEDGERPAVLILMFCVNDIAGCLVAVDREVDPAGAFL